LASLFLGVRASGQYACTASIRSQVEEGQESNADSSDAFQVSQSHSVDDLSILFDIDSQSGLGEEASSSRPNFNTMLLEDQTPLRRQRSASDSLDQPSVSTALHEATPPRRKRLRATKVAQSSLTTALSQATSEAVHQREHGIPSKHERAIKILEECYSDKLTIDEMVKAVSLFEDGAKAWVFIALSAGIIRDAWLRGQIRI